MLKFGAWNSFGIWCLEFDDDLVRTFKEKDTLWGQLPQRVSKEHL
jgi:hypothetical protein